MSGQGKFNPKYFNQTLCLEDLMTLIPGNVYWKNREGFYLGCNETVAQLFNFKSCAEIVGKTIYDLIDKQYADAINQIDGQVMSSGKSIEIEELGPDGNGKIGIYLTKKTPLFDQAGNIIGLLGISINITERKMKEEALERVNKEIRDETRIANIYIDNIISNLPENFYWMDKNSCIIRCNENQAKMLGFNNSTEIIGKNIYEIAALKGWNKSLADEIRKNDLEVMATKKSIKIEEEAISEGKQKTFLSFKNPLIDDKNEVIGVFGVTVDITERKQLENHLIEAKKKAEIANLAKSDFIMNMSHDLRTPFSGILGFAKLLEKNEAKKDKKEMLGYIINSSEKLLLLLNEILDLNDSETDIKIISKQKFNLYDLINDITNLMLAQIKYKRLQFEVIYGNNVPPLLVGDKLRLHRILLNLLSNAIKFTAEGSIFLSIDLIQTKADKIIISFTVSDTGIGIPEGKFDAIFERFERLTASYTGIYPGSGLGLYMVKQFVDDLQGNIKVESKPGKGTKFTCTLTFQQAIEEPNIDSEKTNHSDHISHSTPKVQNFNKVLIVEDNFIAQKIALELLKQQFNCKIDVANTGKEAIDLAKNQYDLILMDIGLPDINGYVATQKIREMPKHKNTLIIGLTAHIDRAINQKARSSGMNKVIFKPLSEELCKSLSD